MRILVTGAAGFIGSNIAERLLSLGHDVVGIDCFTDYYARYLKERNLSVCRKSQAFDLVEADLATTDLARLLDGVRVVFHQAAQAGVRSSWGRDFEIYTHHNILAAQRLLEASLSADLTRFVYASSSSVYGNCPDDPMREDSPTRPYSPYGVTKLAAEHLCGLYWQNYGLPTVSLRYFTVYGPRQRPDMAFNRFITAALAGSKITLYGDGEQQRDFTFIDDAVDANVAAMEAEGAAGKVFNIGGGSVTTVNEVLGIIEADVGKPLQVERAEKQKGDVDRTSADTTLARQVLGYKPSVSLADGIARQMEWHKEIAG